MVNKPHLSSWSVVCLEKVNGGLGFRNLGTFNKALLGKWCWRFVTERNRLWKQLIVGKYRQEERLGKWPPYVYFGQFRRKEIC